MPRGHVSVPQVVTRPHQPLVGGFEVPTILQRASHRNFKSKNHTRVISLLVSLRFRSSHESVPQGLANFGIGTLGSVLVYKSTRRELTTRREGANVRPAKRGRHVVERQEPGEVD